MLRVSLCLVLLGGMVGCAGSEAGEPLPKTVPGSGVVRLDGKPLPFAIVTFIPRGATKGIECLGTTDEMGDYVLKQVRGQDGVPPGEYTVVINSYVKSDGSPVRLDKDEAPANVGAVEKLPLHYSGFSESILMAKVTEAGGEFDFELKSN